MESDLKETCLHSERVYEGVMLDVRRDRVRVPDGAVSVREWIKHTGAAAVVPVLDSGEVLLLRQFRYGPRREFVEVPAGKMDREGEDPLDVARRELCEETGYEAERWTSLGTTYPCIGYSDEVIHLFLAEGLTESGEAGEEGEFVEPFTLPLSDALDRARAGELGDAKTEVALLRAEAHFRARGKSA